MKYKENNLNVNWLFVWEHLSNIFKYRFKADCVILWSFSELTVMMSLLSRVAGHLCETEHLNQHQTGPEHTCCYCEHRIHECLMWLSEVETFITWFCVGAVTIIFIINQTDHCFRDLLNKSVISRRRFPKLRVRTSEPKTFHFLSSELRKKSSKWSHLKSWNQIMSEKMTDIWSVTSKY